MKNYYTLPFDAGSLMEKKRHPAWEIKESIQINVNLILKTHLHEYRFDSSYGCMIWNKDFDSVSNVTRWLTELKSSILVSVEKNESRLSDIGVDLSIEAAKIPEKFKNQPLRMRHRITIKITGKIKHLNEPFEHFEYLFFSPLSIG